MILRDFLIRLRKVTQNVQTWFSKFLLHSLCVVGEGGAHEYHTVCAEVKGQLAGVGPLLPPCVPGTEPRSSVLGLGILASESSCLLFLVFRFFFYLLFSRL